MNDSDINIVGFSNSEPKNKINWKITGAIIGVVVLSLGVIAGILLVRQQQNISEKADTCVEQCPGSDGVLRNCHPPESDGTSVDSNCDTSRSVKFCGSSNFCCPSAGGTWTTNMSACTVATRTATATSTSTATATSTGSKTATPSSTTKATSTPKASATATSAPIPVTGIEWPTILGAGFGIIMVLVSLGLAL